jgi:hypothetical protein
MSNLDLIVLKIFNIWDPVEDKNFWEALFEVPTVCSLYDLHLFIQRTINFENDHLFEFYAGRDERNRKLTFSEQSGYPYDGGAYEEIFLKDIYPLKGLKLFYLFDFGDNWIFEFHKARKKAKFEEGLQYPHVFFDNGIVLKQYINEYDENDFE